MKRNIKSIILVLLFSVTAFSCEDFLQEEPKTVLAPENVFTDLNGATAALLGAYTRLKHNQTQRGLMTMVNGRSDHIVSRGSWAPISEYGAPFNSTNLDRSYQVWRYLYAGINMTNTVISRAVDLPASAEQIDALIGEAKFVRAWSYFYLVRLYGELPIRTEEVVGLSEELLNSPRRPVSDVYDQIISDLQDAEANCVDSWDPANLGRATIWAAKAMLAEVYLTRENWSQAKAKAQEVINGPFSLVQINSSDDYANIYGPAVVQHSEEILSWKFTNSITNDNVTGMWEPKFSGPPTRTFYCNGGSGWAGYLVNKDCPHYIAWDDADLRKDWTTYTEWENADGEILDIRYQGEWPMLRKFRDGDAPHWKSHGNDMPIYRLSDMLLIYAEASSQDAGGPDSDAIEKLNMVKRRAYGYDPAAASPVDYATSGWTAQTFRDAVLIERAYEFMAEGKRWYDLLRTNTMKERIEESYPGQTWNDVNTLYPLPPEEIQNNEGISETDQNPGY